MVFFILQMVKNGSNNKVITYKKAGWLCDWVKVCKYNVITKKLFSLKSNRYVFNDARVFLCNNKVITKRIICKYIVITSLFFPVICQANISEKKEIVLDVYSPIVQGTLVYGRTERGGKVYYQDKQLKLTSDGRFVFAVPKGAGAEITLSVEKNNHKILKTYEVASRKWKEEVVNGLSPKKVSPSEADLKRITADNKMLREGRASTHFVSFPACFVRPVDEKARISSEFGSARVLNGIKTAGHSGTDYALPSGSPIYAPADGEVKVIHSDMFYSGKTILIDHGYGVFSSYSHLSEILVQQGDKVKQGHLIGKIGTTGRSTGPHLHLTLTWFGVRVDPEYVLKMYDCSHQK